MARVELMVVSLEELGGATPTPEAEVVLRGVRYQVLSVTPSKGRPRVSSRASSWKLLLRRPEALAAGHAAPGGE